MADKVKADQIAVLIKANDNNVYQVLLDKDQSEYLLGFLVNISDSKIKCNDTPIEGIVFINTKENE